MFDPSSCRDAGLLSAARALLDEARYDEESVCRALALPTLAALSSDRFAEQASHLEPAPGALPVLLRLLLLEQAVRRTEAEQALGRDAVACLRALGILSPASRGRLLAEVAVHPCDGGLIATDRRLPRRGDWAAGRRQRVMYLGADSHLLACLTPDVPRGSRVLDLCTGSGVHAILAARRGAQATGTDISRRAVAFARFNARLNAVTAGCRFLIGDLYGPLAGRGRAPVDLVLANPPFVPSPFRGANRTRFRDAGPRGDDVLRRVIRGLAHRLVPGGMAVVVSVFADSPARPFEDRLRGWLGPRSELGAVVLVTDRASPEDMAEAHAARWTRAGFRLDDAHRRLWLQAYHDAGIERVRGGVLALVRLPASGGTRLGTIGLAPSWRSERHLLRQVFTSVLGV